MFTADIRYSPRLSAAEQQLAAIPNRLRNMRPLMTQGVAPLAEAMIRTHEETQGAAFGHPWVKLADSTIAKRTRNGTIGGGILHETGDLFRAIFRSLTNGASITPIPGGLRLTLGESAIDDPFERLKFRWHMLGTKVRGVPHVPIRQPIPSPLPRSFRDDVRALVHDFIATGRLRGEGGRFVSAAGVS